jgi:uncharacterized protein
MKRRHSMYAILALAALVIGLALVVRWLEPRLAFFPLAVESETPRTFGRSFEAVTVHTADGERLRAWRIEVRQPRARIVYFHGNGGNLSNWAPILAGIAGRGYSVFAVDYRGYGVSTGRPTERGLYRDVDACLEAAWPTAETTAPLVYWGRSLGAAMAAYAATITKADGIIIEAGFPDARTVIRDSPVLVALSVFSSYRFPVAEFLGAAKAPVLVMHGDHDRVIPFALGRELFDALPGPKRFVVIAGGDHNDATAPDVEGYWAAIDGFIQASARGR